MAGWHLHEGRAVALPLENIDTDQLIPARFMATPRSEGYGRYLLHDLRRDAAGALLAEMPLNVHPEASVLVARRNFGSGSSREAAVYALVDFGIRAVIAPSFGDIFAGNAVNNGLLPLRLAPDRVVRIIAALAGGAGDARIDLERGTLTVAGTRHDVALPPKARQKLLNGWDDIDLTHSHRPEIATFRNTRHTQNPWAWPA
ncbi:MAG: 3-isopropylmalate dehydratase small subunit [Pseudodonghicola sp.]